MGIRPDRSGGQYLKQRRARDAAVPGASKPLFATAFVLGLGIREASEGLYVQRSFLNNVARPPSKDLVIARATGCWRRIVAPPRVRCWHATFLKGFFERLGMACRSPCRPWHTTAAEVRKTRI